MRIAKFLPPESQSPRVGMLEGDQVRPLAATLSDLLHADDPVAKVLELATGSTQTLPLSSVKLLAPIDQQEVWGAGVTYLRSKVARQEESEGAATFYDLVYRASRPELFFKATPSRVVGPDEPIRVRRDTKWCVPEPELALVLSPRRQLVGFTIGNDVSARDIEGENPLYLPQAKVYDACCALGPHIELIDSTTDAGNWSIRLKIVRSGTVIVEDETSVSRMVRKFQELIDWLTIDNTFPDGVILLTGTGIVPPDGFTLQAGDVVQIWIEGIGTLSNPVTQASS